MIESVRAGASVACRVGELNGFAAVAQAQYRYYCRNSPANQIALIEGYEWIWDGASLKMEIFSMFFQWF
ncbi:MAG: hypothetical protein U0798_06085 [Gemmataceae bacterium]